MTEIPKENSDRANIQATLRGKRFMIAFLAFVLVFVGNEVFNMVNTLYEAAATLTYFIGGFHLIFEGYRAFVDALIVVNLLWFFLWYRRGDERAVRKLKLVEGILILNLVVTGFVGFFLAAALGSILLAGLAILAYFGYNIILIRYLASWIGFFEAKKPHVPDPLALLVFVAGFAAFLIFHYFYLQSGGTYSLQGYKVIAMVHTPFLKIAIMLLLQVLLASVVVIADKPSGTNRAFRFVPWMMGVAMLVTLVVMGVTESAIPHYRFNVYDLGSSSSIALQVTNGDQTISALEFTTVVDPDTSASTLRIDGYMERYDYDPLADPGSIPAIDAKLVTTIRMPSTTYVHELYVYDENGDYVAGIHDWSQLDTLDPGSYFVVASLAIHGDPSYDYADYLFVLNVS